MKKQYINIVIIMVIIHIINNMAHPVTPQLISELGKGPAFLGTVFAAMAFSNFLMSPVWGRLSDVHGRKVFMIIAPIGYAIAQIGFGFSTNLVVIILFRLLAGTMASALYICSTAYIIDITSLKDRSRLMVFYTAITGFAANIGYLVGGYIGNSNFKITFIAQASACVFISLFIFLTMKESHVKKAKTLKTNMIQDLKKYQGSIIPFLLLIIFFTGIVFKGFDIGFNSYLKFGLNYDSFMIGKAMAIVGLVGLVTNFLVFPLLKRYFDDLKLLVMSILVMAVSAYVFTQLTRLSMQIIVLIFFFAGLALYKPLLQAILSKAGDKNGEVMGLNNAAHAIGMVFGSIGVGALYEIKTDFAFYSLSLFALLSAILLLIRRRRIQPYAKEI
jgi:DHA1 family multidrug resistance protein-like MFS transporter